MGIRIHKVLGYGLTNVHSAGGSIADCRFNEHFSLSIDNVADFYQWWTENEENPHNMIYANLAYRNLKQGELDVHDNINSIHYENEGGLDNVIVFVSPSSAFEWVRYDDPIDYYEVEGMESTVKELNCPIFPWHGYWDTSTIPPKRLTGDDGALVEDTMNMKVEPSNREIWNSIYKEFKDKGYNWDNIQTVVPPEIVALVKYLKVFNNDIMPYRLKPMIYTYWS